MQFTEPLKTAILLKRYKRFLADVQLDNGETLTVHCPNSGSMKGCSMPGSPVVISQASNLKRKYRWTLEMVKVDGTWVGVNTSRTNSLIHEALENNIIDDFGAIESIQKEIKVSEKSRLDFLVHSDDGKVYIEVKNCSLVEKRAAMFPDAVTIRGTKHLLELAKLAQKGFVAGLIFCVQREDADYFTPAAAIDPVYADTLLKVQEMGVHIIAYRATVHPGSISVVRKLPIRLTSSL